MSRKSKAKARRVAAGRATRQPRFKANTLRNWAIGAAAVAVIAVIIALGLTQSGTGSSGGGEGTTIGPPVAAGGVPDFRVRTTSWSGGREFILSQNLGKPTALYFVAAWCFTCIPETKAWERIHREMGDQVTILIFDVDQSEDEADLLRFKEKAGGGDHLWAMDVNNDIARAYNVRSLDTTVIIDQAGKEVYRDAGPTPYDKLRSVLMPLLENAQ